MHGVMIEEVSRRTLCDNDFESPRKTVPDNLKLSVITGPDSGASGIVLEIGPRGMQNSQRTQKDGQVFIGRTLCDASGKVQNDYIIDGDDAIGDQHLLIRHSFESMQYFLQDLGQGKGTAVRLDKPTALVDGDVLMIGDSQILVAIDNQEFSDITLTVFKGFGAGKKCKFAFDKKVFLGCMKSSDIVTSSDKADRVHCTIEHCKRRWVITDGNGETHSTTGTWKAVAEPCAIEDGTVFRLGNVTLNAKLVSQTTPGANPKRKS